MSRPMVPGDIISREHPWQGKVHFLFYPFQEEALRMMARHGTTMILHCPMGRSRIVDPADFYVKPTEIEASPDTA